MGPRLIAYIPQIKRLHSLAEFRKIRGMKRVKNVKHQARDEILKGLRAMKDGEVKRRLVAGLAPLLVEMNKRAKHDTI